MLGNDKTTQDQAFDSVALEESNQSDFPRDNLQIKSMMTGNNIFTT